MSVLLLLLLLLALPAHLGTSQGWRCNCACVQAVKDVTRLSLGLGLSLQYMQAVMKLQLLRLLTPVLATRLTKDMAVLPLAVLLVLPLGQGVAPSLIHAQHLALGASGFGIVPPVTMHLLHPQLGLPPSLALKLATALNVPAMSVRAMNMPAMNMPAWSRCTAPVQTGLLKQASTTRPLTASGFMTSASPTRSACQKRKHGLTTWPAALAAGRSHG